MIWLLACDAPEPIGADAPTDATDCSGPQTWYPDADGDTYGDPGGATFQGCDPPGGFVLDHTDCDDGNATVHPAADHVILSLFLGGCLAATPDIPRWSTLEGGQSQAIATAPGRILTLNGSSAVWWDGGTTVRAALPQVPVEGARWEEGALLVGPGRLDLTSRKWTVDPLLAAHPALQPGPPGQVGPALLGVAWEAAFVAVLHQPAGRAPEVLDLYDRATGVRTTVDAGGARQVMVRGERVVTGGSAVVVRDRVGSLVARLPVAASRLRADGDTLLVVRTDGGLERVDLVNGASLGVFPGRFVDGALSGPLLIGLDRASRLHLSCAGEEVRVLELGAPAGIVWTDGAQVVVAGGGGVRVGELVGGC